MVQWLCVNVIQMHVGLRSVALPLRARGTGVGNERPSEALLNKSLHTPGWEHFPHEADVGIRGHGATPDGAFEQAALAMTAAVADVERVVPRECVRITCEAPEKDLLLVEWLNALVYEMSARGMLFGRYAVSIEGSRLFGEAWGEPVDVARHRPAAEVKGATYTELEVSQGADGEWTAQCVVDV